MTPAHELEGWRRYAVVLAGMVVCGAVCVLAVPFLIAPRGTIGPTAFQAQSVPAAIAATVFLFAVATAAAAYVGRMVNAAVGMFVLGAGLWILRVRAGTVADLAFARGSLGLVALETLAWSGLILAATVVVFRVAGPLPDVLADPDDADQWWKQWGLPGAAAGIVVLPAVWLIAQSPLKGQTLMSVVLGGMVAGLAGRLISPHAQPVLLFASTCLFGALGQLAAMLSVKAPLDVVFVQQSLPALTLPMPIDYAAGSLMGVAMGVGWAKGFLQAEEEH